MSYIQNYVDHQNLSDMEIKDVVAHSQRSTHKIINLPNGKKEYIFSIRAMLDNNGKPIPIDEFMIKSSNRVMFVPPAKFVEDKAALKLTKKEWNKANPNRKLCFTHNPKDLKKLVEISDAVNKN